MTTIAWDGQTLAADKRVVFGCHTATVTKIFRVGDFLVALAGRADMMGEFVHWIENGCQREAYPRRVGPTGDSEFQALVIKPDGKVLRYESTPFPFEIEDTCHALGSGRDYAIAAMACGKSAREAIEIAARFDENTGNGLDAFDFEAPDL